jgi:solute carrier family 25 (mitochondrial folate transporter), member 32
MIASTVTYPHEVVRTRLQTQLSIPTHQKYTGIIQSIRLIFSQEGIRGFYRGFGISLTRTVPSSALTILTFEMISNYMKDHFE